jgi:hypothetical protein
LIEQALLPHQARQTSDFGEKEWTTLLSAVSIACDSALDAASCMSDGFIFARFHPLEYVKQNAE